MSRYVRTAIITSLVGFASLGTLEPANAAPPHMMMHAPIMYPGAFRPAMGTVGGLGMFGHMPGNPYALQHGIFNMERNLLGNRMYGLARSNPYYLAAALGGYGYGGYGGYGGGYGGYGGSDTPWSSNYGAIITGAPTNDSRDYIALNQAAMANSLMREDLRAKRLQNRRAAFDEMRYEAENTPSPEQIREEMRMQQLDRARNSPPNNEMATGVPLNVLLDSVQRMQARENLIGYAIPLDQEILKHINVTSGKGSNEFFKPGSLPDWVSALDNEAFAADKKRFSEDLFALGKSQLDGKVNTAKANDARKVLNNMRDNLYQLRFSMGSNDYMDGLAYLGKLNDTIDVLAKPDGKKFMDGTFAAKGETIGDLMSYMTKNGLKFGRATPGSEAYYAALYQSMAAYEIGLSKMVTKK
jgi:hypothetical protein